jgi:ribonuclease HI
MASLSTIQSSTELDRVVEKLISCTTKAIDQHTPEMKPSPYAKRWFSPELKLQQGEVNRARRKWQESCATRGRQHAVSNALFQDMQRKRRAWTRTIEKVKLQHWKEFLDKAGEGHLWKAASYMKPRESYGCIPPLKDGTNEVVDNACKAKLFMDAFFPKMAAPEAREDPEPNEEIRWDPITKEEVYRALQCMKARKAPGEDEIPTLVWKQIWPYLSEEIFQIFTASISLGYYPRQWKRARIVVLRKPNKPDYAIPGAYRPISLLNTLGKVLEAVVAKRLSYYAETYNLLPNTQFGGRPGRNTEQALLILSNAIDKAWLRSKVITLVAFDLKGAFNGVNGTVLDSQLKAKGIPYVLRTWITSFMEERTASITFDDFESTIVPLENAGLAQGSPLSPILFIFFNADLVNQPVDHKGGSSAFIDDYFRWVVGLSADENLRRLQEDDIPRIEQWAKQTGSCFAAEKTELIHLTRKKSELSKGQLIIQDTTIKANTTAKLLGVVFDNELRWKPHVQQVLKRATRVNTALGGLRYLRPGQMRQLYQACVTPIVDYASTVWHSPTKDKMHLRALNTIQRSALIRILSAFKSVATATMEVELFTLPTRLRLRQRAQITIVNLFTLPWDHPIQGVLSRARRRRDNGGNGSGPRFPLAEAMKTMGTEQFSGLETINPKPTAPWKLPAFKEIDINPDREKARKNTASLLANPHRVVYSDASGHDNHLGAAAVVLDRNQNIVASRKTAIGSMAHWSIHIAELIGVYYAISLALQIFHQNGQSTRPGAGEAVTILSDSKSAIQAIKNPRNTSGQRVVEAINQSAYELDSRGIPLRLQWIPGHCDDPGNDAADRLAKAAVGPTKTHPFCRPVSREKAAIRRQILKEWEDEWKTSNKGTHLRRIDTKLPAIRSRRLYQSLPRNRAYLLTQLRTGHSWLATHGKALRHREDDKCECGAKETVVHILIDCPRLTTERQRLRKEAGDAFGNVSLMLGAKGQGITSSSAQGGILDAVLDFAEASQRFCSRGPKDPQQQNPRQRPTTGP